MNAIIKNHNKLIFGVVLAIALLIAPVLAGINDHSANIVFIGNFNGVDGDTHAIDSSPSNHTITFNDGGASNKISTTDKVFGASSYYLNDEAATRGLNITGAIQDFAWGNGGYTLHWQMKRTAGTNPVTIYKTSNTTFQIVYSGIDQLYATNIERSFGGAEVTGWLAADNNWHTYDVIRTNQSFAGTAFYRDGVVTNYFQDNYTHILGIDGYLQIGRTYAASNDVIYVDEYAAWNKTLPISDLYPQTVEIAISTGATVSDFTATPTDDMYGNTFAFNDTSTNSPATWNFSILDNGLNELKWFNGTTDAYKNFGWIPSTGGNFTVRLWTQNAVGGNYSAKQQYIDVWNHTPTSFTGTPTSGDNPLLVTFNGTSNNATAYYWEFGDIGAGNTSTLQNITHIYTSVGSYNVNYKTSNSHTYNWSNQTGYITVNVTTAAEFAGAPTEGRAPLEVSFVDMSTGEGLYSWSWVFGDFTDDNTSTNRNPTHIYTKPGYYDVQLTVVGADDTSSIWKNNYIYLSQINASFTVNATSGTVPLSVQFTDTSIDAPTGWAWFFGDEPYNQVWTQVNDTMESSNRLYQSNVILPNGHIVVMGGFDGSFNLQNDVWRSTDGGITFELMTSNGIWEPRTEFSASAFHDGTIILMGGESSVDYLNDVWQSTDEGATWDLVNASAGWTTRIEHTSLVLYDNSVVIIGGLTPGTPYNNVWRSTDGGDVWDAMTLFAGWAGRGLHSSVESTDNNIIIMGGEGGAGRFKDVWNSTTKGSYWMEKTADAGWGLRSMHSSVAMPDGSILVIGGYKDGTGKTNDIWRSTDNGATWIQVNASSEWDARYSHYSGLLPNGDIILFGGYDDFSSLVDVWNVSYYNSSLQNPIHTYDTPGNYSVHLQVRDPLGYNVSYQDTFINVYSPFDVNFTSDVTSGGVPLEVIFNGTTEALSPTAWEWTFGDGGTGNTQNLSHTYNTVGNFTVSLKVTNATMQNTKTKTDYISTWLVPEFYGVPVSGGTPLTVNFYDISKAIPIESISEWNFGDGFGSYDQNASHTYITSGTYTVSLNLTTSYGDMNTTTKINYIDVGMATPTPTPTPPTPVPTVTPIIPTSPVARFVANQTTGYVPFAVQFFDLSFYNATSWAWDFGDGHTSIEQNPFNFYNNTGQWSVTLTATNAYGSNTTIKQNYIVTSEKIISSAAVNFVGAPRDGTVPFTVWFTDLSNVPDRNITAWNWSFGTGNYSVNQNPSYVYTTAGSYEIILSVDAENLENVTTLNATKPNYITANAPITATTIARIPMLPAIPKQNPALKWISDNLAWLVALLLIIVAWLVLKRR